MSIELIWEPQIDAAREAFEDREPITILGVEYGITSMTVRVEYGRMFAEIDVVPIIPGLDVLGAKGGTP